jgi:microcystin-dependent protein
MRKFYSILLAVCVSVSLFAQAPQKMSYQAVIRNSNNQLVTNQAVGMKISILQGSASGIPVYTETQTTTTNSNGLVSIEIGGGVGFDAIDWSGGSYFIKTETDPAGGTNYTISGTSQLLSVPYALYSKTSGSSLPGPKGDQGIQGLTGAKGDQGIQGLTGAKGDQGIQGTAGAKGDQGIQGLTGAKGDQGIQGTAGAKGDQGIQGLTGAKGDQGIQGIQGLTGAKGDQGIQGIQGLSGAKGDQGIQGIQGLTGAKGDQGDPGVAFDDTQVLINKTWTSSKINTVLATKANISSLAAVATSGAFSDLSGKPTTLAGYGITNAMSTSHPANGISSANITDWNTAAGWGNHATQGYIKNTSPTVAGNLMTYDGTNWVSKKLVIGSAGNNQPVANMQPYLTLNYCIAIYGIFPSRNSAEPFVGEIELYAFNFEPQNFAYCNGQILSIAQNTALFALIGTYYGGNGQTTFALPDLRGRVAIQQGQGPGLSNYSIGQTGGSETITLNIGNIPTHTHTVIFQ